VEQLQGARLPPAAGRQDDKFWVGQSVIAQEIRMGIFELALGVGAYLFCGVALGAVGIEAYVGVEIGEGSLVIFLAEMDQGKEAGKPWVAAGPVIPPFQPRPERLPDAFRYSSSFPNS